MRLAVLLSLSIAACSPVLAQEAANQPMLVRFEKGTDVIVGGFQHFREAARRVKQTDDLEVYVCSLTATGNLSNARVFAAGEALRELDVEGPRVSGGECPPEVSGLPPDQIPADSLFMTVGTEAELDRMVATAEARRGDYVPDEGWEDDERASFYEHWLGNQLAAMKEPTFRGSEALGSYSARYRLLVLPNWDPAFAVRVDISIDGTASVRSTILDGAGGYSPGSIASESTSRVGREIVEPLHRLATALSRAEFPRELLEPENEFRSEQTGDGYVTRVRLCLHPTAFVIETLDAGGHQMLVRNTCDDTEEQVTEFMNALLVYAPEIDFPY